MATYTNQGLLDSGLTSANHYSVQYDKSFSGTVGQTLATELMNTCEADFGLMSSWFHNDNLPLAGPIVVQIANRGAGGLTNTTLSGPSGGPYTASVTVTLGALDPELSATTGTLLRYTLVAEVTEVFMLMQNNGWRYLPFPETNEGSMGEGLSRFLAAQFLLINGLSAGPDGSLLPSGASLSYFWLNQNQRADYVNHPNRSDNQPDAVTACALLFIYYLHTQLGFAIDAIVASGASTLAGVYNGLTDDFSDPFPFFQKLLHATFPPPAANGGKNYLAIPGPNPDNPFPIEQQMQIQCITKPDRSDISAHILSVGGTNRTFNEHFYMPRQDCMTLLSGGIVTPGQFCGYGNYRFFVEGGGSQADVAIFYHNVPGPDGEQLTSYLATNPDRTKADNLLSLPECS